MPPFDRYSRWTDTRSMDELNAYRRPVAAGFEMIVQHIVEHTIDESLAARPWLEICCGDGQLRTWLPEAYRERTVHLDSSTPLLQRLRQHHPTADVRHADVYRLPFEANSFAAVVGLCAFDSLDRQAAARDEILRVLDPGGLFVHFLDMQSNLEPVFAEIVGAGSIPLPNFLDSPDLSYMLDGQMRERLPTCRPLDDLVSIDREAFLSLLNFLQRTANPMAGELVLFADCFVPERFDAGAATAAFMKLLQDSVRLSRANQTLLCQALTFGEGQHREVPPLRFQPCASIDLVSRRMEGCFQPENGFETTLSEIVSLREVRRREPGMPPVGRYHRRCVGKSEWLPAIPKSHVGTPLATLSGADTDKGDPGRPGDDEVVIEVGMHVLIARKLPEASRTLSGA